MSPITSETFSNNRGSIGYNIVMVCFNHHSVPFRQVAAEEKKESPKKRPLQISENLHSLVTMMAADKNLSLEQVVSKAVIKEARAALDTPDSEKQRRYFIAIKATEDEIKQRYIGEQSRRSAQMRRINAQRRKKSAAPISPSSPVSPTPRFRPVNAQGYPVEYRYGFAVPKPTPSSYPTY